MQARVESRTAALPEFIKEFGVISLYSAGCLKYEVLLCNKSLPHSSRRLCRL